MPGHDEIELGGKRFKHAMVDAGDVRLHTVSGGKGFPILLMAGFPQSWYAWRRIMPILADHFYVVAIDLPGQGDSDKPVDGYDTQTAGDRIHALVKELGFERYHIGAHDIGSWVAYPFVARFADEVGRLVLLDANIPGVTLKPTVEVGPNIWKSWHFFFHQVPDVPEFLITGRERSYIEWFFQRKTFNPAGTFSTADIDEYERVYKQPGNLRGALAYYRAVLDDAEQNTSLAAKKIETPILALGGDFGMSPDIYDAMKPLATHVEGGVIQNCGHYMPEEQPDEIAAKMIKFFNG
ncbi:MULTISPECIES: alpha/beta fold hydrolase [Halomonadaceae]|jgi:pimeloyl-ACP methyl ester carboxylesterase|uniref:alpha/beta fold hydrolase n=1 Tax=Halomonadaceae TaxID=28256 RepID=UPI0012EF4192|nr:MULTISPECIES: alpha/beta hydrolase [Halomonas]CAD5269043.1 Alpha/beta hydrolase [Halomonas sp. I3]CAD5274946.1 Alpha/beta hydrolase [Halomonas sp. 113]CAD5276686.1 Alpha/beta hydrolase [Halomonas sp. 59]CAD5276975.1 Alpha/beta hydrolase [Halomonas sp. 156]VXB98400.1 Alpha/beta hydrolase [Halomonas titanicae]